MSHITEFEESKIRSIVIKSYISILDREPDSIGLSNYINKIQNGLSISDFQEILRNSEEYKEKIKNEHNKISINLNDYKEKYKIESDKLTLICPTYDNLEYLKLFYESYIDAKLKFHNNNDNIDIIIDIIIGINGNDKLTEQFCINNNIKYTIQEKLGMYSATNLAVSKVTDSFLIILNDDIYLDKMFFKYLSLWLTKDSVLFSNSIQPSPAGGTFKPWYNWGETYENFDKNGFLKYCREIEKHESSFHTFGVVYVIHYTNWIKVNGFDEKFDPWGGGMADLMYRLFLTGVRNFSLLHDVLHYHFIRKCGKKHNYFSNITNGNITMQKITDKWNKDFKEIDNIIKEGCCYKCL